MSDMRPERPWTTVSRAASYRGRVTLVDHTVRLEDGTLTQYEVDESIPFAVATLVIDGDDLLLAREYRYPLGRWIYDLPGGAGEPGERPETAARRELEEELGLVARRLTPLHTFSLNPARAAWPVHVFACTAGTTPGRADDTDASEQVRMARVSVRELDAMITAGEIVDPTLLVARAVAAMRGLLPPLGTAD